MVVLAGGEVVAVMLPDSNGIHFADCLLTGGELTVPDAEVVMTGIEK